MADTPYPLPDSIRQTEWLVGDGSLRYGPFAEGWGIFDEGDVLVETRPVAGGAIGAVECVIEKATSARYASFYVTFPVAITSTTEFRLTGLRGHERDLAVTRGGAVDGASLELELSKQAVVLQEVRRDVDRAVKVLPDQTPDYLDVNALNSSEANALRAEAAADRIDLGEFDLDVAQVATDRAIVAGQVAVAEAAAATAVAAAATAGAAFNVFDTWALLSANPGSLAGEVGEVLPTDAGTHTDPVVGGTVANAGGYVWSVSPAGWRRTGSGALATEAALRAAGDKKNLFRVTTVTGTGVNYAGTVAEMTRAELESGYPIYLQVTFNVANTSTAPTLNLNAGGGRLVRTQDDQPPAVGQVRAGVPYVARYEGTRIYLLGEFGGTNRLMSKAVTDALQTAIDSKAQIVELTGVAGTASSYTAVCAIPRATMEDGTVRLVYFQPHLTNEVDDLGRTFLAIDDDASPNLVRTMDDRNLVQGQLKATTRYLMLQQGARYFVVGLFASSSIPERTSLNLTSAEEAGQAHGWGIESLPEDRDYTRILTGDAPYTASFWNSRKGIECYSTSGFVDVRFLYPNVPITISCPESAAGSVCRIFCGATHKWKGHANKVISIAAGTDVIVKCTSRNPATADGVKEFSVQVGQGSVNTAPSQTIPTYAKSMLVIGQSLGQRAMDGSLMHSFQSELKALGLAASVNIIQAAVGSTGVMKGSSAEFLYDQDLDALGTLGTNAVAMVNASIAAGQPAPDVIFFATGQADSNYAFPGGHVTFASYKAAVLRTVQLLNTALSLSMKAIILNVGSEEAIANISGSNGDQRYSVVRAALYQAIVDNPTLLFAAPDWYDTSNASWTAFRLDNDPHMTHLGNYNYGKRLARVYANVAHGQSNDLGPRVISWTENSPTSFTARIQFVGALNRPEAGLWPRYVRLVPPGTPTSSMVPIEPTNVTFSGGLDPGLLDMNIEIGTPTTGARLLFPYGIATGCRESHGYYDSNGKLPLRSYLSP